MFIAGLEVDLENIFRQRVSVVLISNFSILVPFVLGIGLARLLYPQFVGSPVPFSRFALFMGTAMSITAFPVLARILKERNLLGTEIGTMAISCAAIDDVSAWLLLAVLTAIVHSSQNWGGLSMALLKLLLFLAFMLLAVRRGAAVLRASYMRRGLSLGLFSVVIGVMLVSSWTTEQLGVHALFGAFVAGLIIPREKGLITGLVDKIESFTLVILLPVFFVLTGLRTRMDLIAGPQMWGYVVAIIGVAVAGKFAGASLTSYLSGMRLKDSIALGILMNTRGLVEIVVLNVGLELGIVSSSLFTMMVLMALVTTLMTTPLLAVMKLIPAADRPELAPALSANSPTESPKLERVG